MPIHVPSIVERQRLGVTDGRIRFGASTMVRSPRTGKMVKKPYALEHLRFTSQSRFAIEVVAELFGGQARPWGGQWEVFTETAEVPVLVRGDRSVDQWMELWDLTGRCVRRCTGGPGARNLIDGEPCSCPADDRERKRLAQEQKACKPTTRFYVRLIQVPGIGSWLAVFGGETAAVDLPQGAAVLEQTLASGQLVPATLAIVQVERPGKKYVIPRLDFKQSVAEIKAGRGGVGTLAELAANCQPLARALTAGPATGNTPAPAESQHQPAPASPADYADYADRRAAFAQRTADWAMRNDVPAEQVRTAIVDFIDKYRGDPVMNEFVTVADDEPDVELGDFLADRLRSLSSAQESQTA